MNRNLSSLAIAVGVWLTASGPGEAQQSADLDAVFARWDTDRTPGCAVGIEQNGRRVAEAAYGQAQLEHGVPATTATIYEAGSVAKQFTAAAILLLERDGLLSLDDDVRRHVPELPDYGTVITIGHLLSHVSGLRDWGAVAAMEGWPRGSRRVNHDHVLEILARQRALNFAPGSEWLYSNSGYNLAAIIVERVSGRSLADFTAQRMFAPLGMVHTRWRDDHTEIVPGRATAYGRRGGAYHEDMPFEDAYGNGGLLTTVGDLLIWNRALDEGRLGEGIAERLARRSVLTGGRATHYGLGLQHETHEGSAVVGHGGATGGYRAWLGRHPDHGLSLAILCNAGDANTALLARQVAALFLPEPPPSTSSDAAEPPPVGLFADERTGAPLGLRMAGGRTTTVQGQPLEPGADGTWRLGGQSLRFVSPDRFEMTTPDGDIVGYERRTPVSPDEAALADYAGTYVSDEAPARLSLLVSDGRLMIRRGLAPPEALAPTYADVFASPAGVVRFERDAAGAVRALHLNNGRVRDMTFTRVD